jgi:S1-C subfamily serine protease
VTGSVGEFAGIQVGDFVVSVDGTAVGTVNEFIEAIHEGDRTKMICLRADGEEKTVDVEFPERSE